MRAFRAKPLAVASALVALAAAVFLPVAGHEFLNFDDTFFVTANRHVSAGLSAAGARWAFTAVGYGAGWHPLTWLSHMLDVSLFGLRPGPHHLVNLLLHACSTVLLFLLLRGATGALWPPALVAALFAVHPLQVQSVAWIADRTDVLSTLLWLCAFGAWGLWRRRGGRRWYAASLGLTALALLAKPMPVSMPAALLVLELWPLGSPAPQGRARRLGACALAALPFALLSLASAAATVAAKSTGGAMGLHGLYALPVRLGNALVGAAAYLGKAAWPHGLAAFYPFDPGLRPAAVAAAAGVLSGVTLLCALQVGRRPWLAAGWLWYAVTLLPASGIVQAGFQAMADRYVYVPAIGIFLALAWTGAEAARRVPQAGNAVSCAAAACVLAFALSARREVGFWADSATLFRRAIAVTEGNWLAENNLGRALEERGDAAEARRHYERALAIQPDFPIALVNLGNLMLNEGDVPGAVALYRRAAALDGTYFLAPFNLGVALARDGRYAEAEREFRRVIATAPDYADAHRYLGEVLLRQGRRGEAGAAVREAERLSGGAGLH